MPASISFFQQQGLWKRRGAHPAHIELALGNVPAHWPEGARVDDSGYNIWHYWAYADTPEDTWNQARQHIGAAQDLHCAKSGEHPLHRLCLTNKQAAATLWLNNAQTPLHATMGLDTYWHALAWSGSVELVNTVGPHLPEDSINALDDSGSTAVMIAAHRGGIDLVKAFLFFGADPNLCDEQNRSLLHHVALYGDISFYTEMQDFGATDEGKNDRGQTPKAILSERMKHGKQADFASTTLHWNKRFASKLMF